jgi:hypothetical protein
VSRLDWEEVRHRNHRLQVAREQLDPEDMLDAIVDHFDPDGNDRVFGRYRKVKEERQRAEKAVEAQLGPETHSQLAPLRGLSVKAVAELARHVGRHLGDPATGEQVGQVIETFGEPAVDAALVLLRQRVGEQTMGLVVEPHRQLARALGNSLAQMSNRRPLVFIQDTYEIVDAVDGTLREAIYASGPRLLWLIAGRRDLASSNSATHFVGYNVVTDRIRLRALPEIGEFSLTDIVEYFAEAAPGRPLPDDGAARVLKATEGIPLAVRLAAGVWQSTGSIEEIERDAGSDRDEIVAKMADRFLIHCTDAGERRQIYALGLLRRPSPALLQAMTETEGNAAQVLSSLSERHPFIFVAARQGTYLPGGAPAGGAPAARGARHERARLVLEREGDGAPRAGQYLGGAAGQRALGGDGTRLPPPPLLGGQRGGVAGATRLFPGGPRL